MSKDTHDCLTRFGTGCFIAVRTHIATVGVKGLTVALPHCDWSVWYLSDAVCRCFSQDAWRSSVWHVRWRWAVTWLDGRSAYLQGRTDNVCPSCYVEPSWRPTDIESQREPWATSTIACVRPDTKFYFYNTYFLTYLLTYFNVYCDKNNEWNTRLMAVRLCNDVRIFVLKYWLWWPCK